MRTIIKKHKGGGVDILLKCKECGELIDRTSVEFGMDCKNHCQEKQGKKLWSKMTNAQKQFYSFFLPKIS